MQTLEEEVALESDPSSNTTQKDDQPQINTIKQGRK